MKRLFGLVVACGAVGMLAGGLQAQSYRVTSHVPFSFIVNGKTCPAGAYALQAEGYHTFEYLRNLKGQCSVFMNSTRSLEESAARPRLLFHRYGNTYFLWQVWNGQGTGSLLPVSERERKMQEVTPVADIATATVEMLNGQ
jgi:hypothetical protein